ncbi:endoplasmic reticulum export factor secretory 16 [Arctopsyche grandis]|uniref:endoplasmic reticulum export factor secretory 16 n=1 Tax=Arctopsyche grandis TaxID=121162 RepID=UPI00406D9C29
MSWMKRPRGSPAPPPSVAPAAPSPLGAPQPPLLHHQPPLPSNQTQPWIPSAPNNPPLPQGGYTYGNLNASQPSQQPFWPQQPQNANQQNAYNHNYNQQNFPPPPPQQQQQQQTPYQNEYYQYNQQQQYPNPNSNTYAQQQNYNAYSTPPMPNQQYNTPQGPQQTPNYSAPRSNFQGPNLGDQDANESDPWNWGWDENSTADRSNTQKPPANVTHNPNANILSDSFSNTCESWNYAAADPYQNDNHQNVTANHTVRSRTSSRDGILSNESNAHNVVNDHNIDPAHFVDSASQVREAVPNQAVASFPVEPVLKNVNKAPFADGRPVVGKTHIGNIPQGWSTESQPSQESSDGLLSHTESTTGSEDPSRSFDKNSPGLSLNDNTNFNYTQPGSDYFSEVSYNQNLPNMQHNYVADENQQLVDGVRTMNINSENLVPMKNVPDVEHVDSSNATSEESSNVNLAHNLSSSTGRDSSSPNLPTGLSKPPMSMPPSGVNNFPHASNANLNPFKRTGQLSHRSMNINPLQPPNTKPGILMNQQPIQDVPFQQDVSGLNLRQPSPLTNVDDPNNVANRSVHHANLETTPDNSERPDNPSPVQYPVQYPHPVHQTPVENCEIAPNNDRNEYLQTGHLSDAGFNDNTNFRDSLSSERRNDPTTGSDNYPPPGLRRMVLGQPESQFNQSSLFALDDPPPGLSRMVPGHIDIYNQSNDDYLDRQVDGQTTESDSLTNSAYMGRNSAVYRQVDGQPTDDESNYNQAMCSRISLDRRPLGFDRMVPGEASSDIFTLGAFQIQSFSGANEERVVTGLEQVNSSETREQNMDGSDYSEVDANQLRNVVGATEVTVDSRNVESNTALLQNMPVEPDLQRDRNMEGENLQDLSAISSTDFSMIRDQNMDGADMQEEPVAMRKIDQDSGSDRLVSQKSSQQMSNDKDRKYREDTTGDESERDRMYKVNSLRKDKEGSRLRSSRERDNRYNDRRDDRRSDKDRRGADFRSERDSVRNEDRRFRKTRDNRYDTEDTDYSDRDRRRYREGSYSSSKPPRPDDRRRDDDSRKSYDRSGREDRRRRDDVDRDRKYDSYESERDGNTSRRRDKDYVDDDRQRRYGTVERERNLSRRDRGGRDERKRNDPRYRPVRPDSRDPDPAEEDPFDDNAGREQRRDRRPDERDRDFDRDRRSHRPRRDRERNEQYYERYGYPMDAYSQQLYQQHQTYQYYEKMRMTNPQAYLEIYNKYMSGATQGDVSRAMSGYGEGYASLPSYDPNTSLRLGDDRGSVHSGRSSANGEAIKDRMIMDGSGGYYYPYRRLDNTNAIYMKQETPTRTRGGFGGSIRTDYSDSRDFNTDASLNQFLDDSTVRSERLTPVRFATAHIKGVLSSPNLVIVTPSYPSDGQPAIVEILNINKVLANDPIRCELMSYPGPLIKGTTHKKTVIEFCEMKIRMAIEKYSSLGTHDKGIYVNQLHLSSAQVNSSDKSSSSSHVTDLGSIVLMWELLILLLRQNGMVVGTDIAELLVKNKNQYVWRGAVAATAKGHSRRDSASSATSRSADLPIEDSHHQQDASANPDVDHDSSNETSVQSVNARKERKLSKDNSAASKMGRKASSNLENSHIQNEEKYVTDKFREYLLFGSGKDALEWAMSHGLWGHALFLASKLDRRTYANVMARFANGLLPNDPLQTLYQLMSGRQPAAVTCVLDEKWGDWRPHLAMILSNTSQRPELDKKSITSLGDTLQARGDLHAAQFCYLMARVEFGKRPIKLQAGSTPISRLVLLGSSPSNENFTNFASNEAIMMTEIYEYACSLNDDSFVLLDFQFYKYLVATRLMDYGFYDRALFYMEKIAQVISQYPGRYDLGFVDKVLQIADRLKHYDPEEHVGEIVDDIDPNEYDGQQSNQRTAQSEQTWITNLRQTVHDLNMSVPIQASPPHLIQTTSNHYDQTQAQPQYHIDQNQNWNQQYQSYNNPQLQQQQLYNQQQQQQPVEQINQQQYGQEQQYPEQHTTEGNVNQSENEPAEQPQLYDANFGQNNGSLYYSPGSVPYSEHETPTSASDNQQHDSSSYGGSYANESGYWNQDNQNQQQQLYGYEDNDVGDVVEQPRPQISMPNAVTSSQSSPYYEEDHDTADSSGQRNQTPGMQQKPKDKPNKKDDASANKGQASSGWFGGIFNKLSLKPKNQMILPDDKNPTIVWDPEKKKWTNLDADEDEQVGQLAPPPKMPEILKHASNFTSQNQMPPPAQQNFPSSEMGMTPTPPAANSGNIFKLQKSRHIKKSYVDVFNPSGAPMRPLPPASEVLGNTQQTAAPQNYFVPQSNANDQSAQMAPSFYNPSDYAS